MRNNRALLLAIVATASIATAQVGGVGMRDVAWANTTGNGTPVLDAEVFYPADVGGQDVPMSPHVGRCPVIVFLHGYSFVGSDYAAIGDRMASRGFVTVMLNTGQWSYLALEYDGRAMFGALAATNSDPASPFYQRLDMKRVGVMGHSMGGGVAAYVMYDVPGPLCNPGYKCALALAPHDPGLPAASVHAPFGIVSGEGDQITPPLLHAQPFYEYLAPKEGLKFHYRMDWSCDHMNVAGLSAAGPEVFDRAMAIAGGFFGQFLGDDPRGLEPVLGAEGLSEAHLVQVDRQVVTPVAWCDSPLSIGRVTRLSVASENGYVGMLGAHAEAGPISTPIGDLLLDPTSAFAIAQTLTSTQRFDLYLPVPNNPLLVGVTFAVQGAGATVTAPFLLGSAMAFRIN